MLGGEEVFFGRGLSLWRPMAATCNPRKQNLGCSNHLGFSKNSMNNEVHYWAQLVYFVILWCQQLFFPVDPSFEKEPNVFPFPRRVLIQPFGNVYSSQEAPQRWEHITLQISALAEMFYVDQINPKTAWLELRMRLYVFIQQKALREIFMNQINQIESPKKKHQTSVKKLPPAYI